MKEHLKVLVVDDDRRMVRTICDILTFKGYKSISAYSGEEAVLKANAETLDCVLMDLKMSGIDGVETLRRIKIACPEIPVVLMSAFASDEKMVEAKRQGAFAVLAKPIDIQLVLAFLSILKNEESILIVDDDPEFCRMLKDILRARGYRVVTETDAAKVLIHMELDYKLLVVLDLKLGAADGVDVLGKIRERYPTKPVVMVTGYKEGMAATIECGLRVGAYTCLYKPFTSNELIEVIDEISKIKLRKLLGESL